MFLKDCVDVDFNGIYGWVVGVGWGDNYFYVVIFFQFYIVDNVQIGDGEYWYFWVGYCFEDGLNVISCGCCGYNGQDFEILYVI